ncbi:hypothetical protein LOM8899_01376 [Flavimaricola marinus]|uniref:Uncharacterized protein n=2 Tax=Flavimaricola marinus TaxID=1819565 RepID=A0A238LCF4_9RHOB|nr:hypothetical protein LOM8899_01376 [Flavimaricola marinus]
MEDDWKDNPSIMAMVDAALLGFIRANPTNSKTDDPGVRLRSAKKALFGIPPPSGKPVALDIPELITMAQKYADERGPYEVDERYVPFWLHIDDTACTSVTELARIALTRREQQDNGYRPHNRDEKIRNLVNKFNDQRDGLLRLVVGWGPRAHDDVVNMNLREIKNLLVILGIPFENPSLPSRDANTLN